MQISAGGGRQGRNKTKPMVHKLGVTLEELYNGKTRKIAANRDIKCDSCDGKGGTMVILEFGGLSCLVDLGNFSRWILVQIAKAEEFGFR